MGSCTRATRRCMFRCLATLLLWAGLILCILGLATKMLFASLLKGRQSLIRKVDVSFGLFYSSLYVAYRNESYVSRIFRTDFSDIPDNSWSSAQVISILAVLSIIVTAAIHTLTVLSFSLKKWYILLIEIILFLFIISFLVAAVALIETHLYYLNGFGDIFMMRLLRSHNLLRYTGGPLDRSFKGPLASYWLLVAADFCILLTLLCCLPEFIVLVEEKREKDKKKKEESKDLAYV